MKKKIIGILLISLIFNASAFAEEEGNPVAGNVNSQEIIVDAFDAAISGGEIIFPYQTNKVYKIYCQEGFLTDIKFSPGEKITYAGAGDTQRWIIDRSSAGNGRTAIEHLYIKPVQRGINTNLVINTNKRSYQLTLISGNFYNPVVSWVVEAELQQMQKTQQIKEYTTINSQKLNFNYSWNKKELPWSPARIFDDGKKTYLKMKPNVFSQDVPAFFIINKNGDIVLANYRLIKGTYIIDRTFDKAQLKVGKEKITIKKQD